MCMMMVIMFMLFLFDGDGDSGDHTSDPLPVPSATAGSAWYGWASALAAAAVPGAAAGPKVDVVGGVAEIITAPNGARIYDKALEAVSKIVYTEPTVENLGDGVWIIGGYSIANFCVIESRRAIACFNASTSPVFLSVFSRAKT